MLPSHEVEDLLERFRDWLTATNEELDAESVRTLAQQLTQGGLATGVDADSNGTVGLLQVVETVTALRQDLKLQSKGVRSLREATELALEGLHRAAEQFDQNQKEAQAAAEQAVRPFVEKLLTLDELIGQAQRSLANVSTRKSAPTNEDLARALEARYRALPRWRRVAAAFWHQAVRDMLREHQHQSPSPTGENELLDGFRLLRTRATAALEDAGIERIACVGKRVDPSTMRVVDVVEPAGRPPETVVDELRPGYTYRGSVVRFAEVRATRGG